MCSFTKWYFKTSYVEVYLLCLFQILGIYAISKHLMLKFITFANSIKRQIANFKTSYVEVYPRPEKSHLTLIKISKHLMLKFIQLVCPVKDSCERISKHLMLKFIQWRWILRLQERDFKTSYVEVYRFIFPLLGGSLEYFKTSYVEVYHRHVRTDTAEVWISKHLMLKFIFFSHLLCCFILKISKHLMLKFIPICSFSNCCFCDFKTSYVEVYPHIFSLLLSPFIYFPLHFSWFLSFLPSISPYSFSYPISHKFPDFTILSQHFSFFRLVNISTTHNQAWGARQMSSQLKMRDHKVSRSKTRLCMTKMGIDPIYPQIIIKHTITNLFFIFKAK